MGVVSSVMSFLEGKAQPLAMRSLIIVGLSAFSTPAFANPAQSVLISIEKHCIQPGRGSDWFLSVPEGWVEAESAALEDLFLIVASRRAVFTGLERMEPGDDPSDYQAEIDEDRVDKANDLRRDYDRGLLRALVHADTGATLIVRMQDERWLHLECVAWPAAEDRDLAAMIRDQWTLPVPNLTETPFGTEHSLTLPIQRDTVVAEVNARVYELPPETGPVPLLLEFSLQAP